MLKLKEYRRELKLLKEQKQTLRKSPERRVGQILLAPYRLPGKTGENGLEKAAPTRTRTPPFRRLKRISGMVRAASRDFAGPGTNATRIACVSFEAAD